jgi:hypothetical protein
VRNLKHENIIAMNLTGAWKGFYVYGPEYGEELHNEKVQFIIHLNYNEGTFEGTSIDIDGVGSNFEKATIKGFIENGFISFIKQYPFSMMFEEFCTGTWQMEKDSE